MKVLVILPTKAMYGDNIAILNIIPYLVKMGHDFLFVIEKGGECEKILIEKQYNYCVSSAWFKVSSMNEKRVTYYRHVKRHCFDYIRLYCNFAFINRIKAFNPDVVYTNNSLSNLGLIISARLGVPHVFHIREYVDKDANLSFWPSKRIFISRFNKRHNYNITITNGIKDYFGLKVNTRTIYDGVINTEEKPRININKKKYFLYVGRITEVKGIEQIIDAFCEFVNCNPDYELWLAGTGTQVFMTKLQTKISGMPNENKIIFLGYRKDVDVLMSEATALIVASQFEAFGFITAEAMFNGCVVIGKDTGGTGEQIDNMEKLAGVPSGFRFVTTQELIDAMKYVVRNPVPFSQLQKISRNVVKLYSSESSAKSVSDYLSVIIETDSYNVYKK